MPPSPADSPSPTLFRIRLILLGISSFGLYYLLFTQEAAIIAIAKSGRWQALVIIFIAFLFSTVHGMFTSDFWEFLGIRANKALPAKVMPTTDTSSD